MPLLSLPSLIPNFCQDLPSAPPFILLPRVDHPALLALPSAQQRRVAVLQSSATLPQPLFFVHLAKTGGTTLAQVLKRYAESLARRSLVHFWDIPSPQTLVEALNKQAKGKLPVGLFGHLPWGSHRFFMPHFYLSSAHSMFPEMEIKYAESSIDLMAVNHVNASLSADVSVSTLVISQNSEIESSKSSDSRLGFLFPLPPPPPFLSPSRASTTEDEEKDEKQKDEKQTFLNPREETKRIEEKLTDIASKGGEGWSFNRISPPPRNPALFPAAAPPRQHPASPFSPAPIATPNSLSPFSPNYRPPPKYLNSPVLDNMQNSKRFLSRDFPPRGAAAAHLLQWQNADFTPSSLYHYDPSTISSFLASLRENVHYAYATMLRHPVERVWSHYQYHLTRTEDPNHRYAKGKTLEQWIVSTEFGRDAMTAMLSGAAPTAWFNANATDNDGVEIEMLPERPAAHSAADPNPGYAVTESHFRMAVRHLRSMMFVGIQEHFEESLQQLEFLLGFRDGFYSSPAKNVNRKKASVEVDYESKALILKHNKYDMMLYDEGVRMFKEQQEILKQRGLVFAPLPILKGPVTPVRAPGANAGQHPQPNQNLMVLRRNRLHAAQMDGSGDGFGGGGDGGEEEADSVLFFYLMVCVACFCFFFLLIGWICYTEIFRKKVRKMDKLHRTSPKVYSYSRFHLVV